MGGHGRAKQGRFRCAFQVRTQQCVGKILTSLTVNGYVEAKFQQRCKRMTGFLDQFRACSNQSLIHATTPKFPKPVENYDFSAVRCLAGQGRLLEFQNL